MKEYMLAYSLLTMQPAVIVDGDVVRVQCGPYGQYSCAPTRRC